MVGSEAFPRQHGRDRIKTSRYGLQLVVDPKGLPINKPTVGHFIYWKSLSIESTRLTPFHFFWVS